MSDAKAAGGVVAEALGRARANLDNIYSRDAFTGEPLCLVEQRDLRAILDAITAAQAREVRQEQYLRDVLTEAFLAGTILGDDIGPKEIARQSVEYANSIAPTILNCLGHITPATTPEAPDHDPTQAQEGDGRG